MKLLILVLLALCTVCSSLRAEPLRFLGHKNRAPYSLLQQGEGRGIDVEVFAEVCRRAGLEYSLELVSHEEMITALQAGLCDGVIALQKSPELEPLIFWVEEAVMHYGDYGLFVRAGSKVPFDSWETLAGRRVGLTPDTAMSDVIIQAIGDAHIVPRLYAGEEECIAGLLSSEIAVFLGQVDVTYYLLERMGMTSTVICLPQLVYARRPFYIALSRNGQGRTLEQNQARAKRFSTALRSVYRDGTYNTLARRYLFRF